MESFGRIVWKKLAIFCGRFQRHSLIFVEIPVCSTLQKLLFGLEETVGWGQLRRAATEMGAGNKAGMNDAGHSTGIFLTDPSFEFSHSDGGII